jgi:GINS complex subunit 4
VQNICRQINNQDREINQRAQNKLRANIADERFYLNILRMELERVKYLLKSYLRTRIIKIERFLIYLVEKDQAHLLSQAEMEYAWTLLEAKKDHFKSEFFDKITKKLNNMERDIDD